MKPNQLFDPPSFTKSMDPSLHSASLRSFRMTRNEYSFNSRLIQLSLKSISSFAISISERESRNLYIAFSTSLLILILLSSFSKFDLLLKNTGTKLTAFKNHSTPFGLVIICIHFSTNIFPNYSARDNLLKLIFLQIKKNSPPSKGGD